MLIPYFLFRSSMPICESELALCSASLILSYQATNAKPTLGIKYLEVFIDI
jgi:hypothetical protein